MNLAEELRNAEVLAHYYQASGKTLAEVLRHPYFEKMSLEGQKEFVKKYRKELSADPSLLSHLTNNSIKTLLSTALASYTLGKIVSDVSEKITGNVDALGVSDARTIIGVTGLGLHVAKSVSDYLKEKSVNRDLHSAKTDSDLARKIVAGYDRLGIQGTDAHDRIDKLRLDAFPMIGDTLASSKYGQ